VFNWHRRFAQGTDDLEDHEHISQPRTVRTELKIEEVAIFVPAKPETLNPWSPVLDFRGIFKENVPTWH
jgi:hypothetical protein